MSTNQIRSRMFKNVVSREGMSRYDVLELQFNRGFMDAKTGSSYGHHNEDCAYPNPKHQDVTRTQASEAYRDGWNAGRA